MAERRKSRLKQQDRTAEVDEAAIRLHIEPFPKSRAKELPSDSIALTGDEEERNCNDCRKNPKVEFHPFVNS
jgi:hypothetical protein